jgi:hypothetical protein
MVVESRRHCYEIQLFNLQQTEEGKYIVNNTVFEWQDKTSLESEGMCCAKHAHVSQTLLASLYVYRLDSILVLYISSYALHLYKQRSNKTYSCSRLIKLAQATKAQKPASSNMCEPAPKDATKSIANFKTGFYRLFQTSNIRNTCY